MNDRTTASSPAPTLMARSAIASTSVPLATPTGVIGATRARELLLEGRDLGPQDVAPAVDDAGDGLLDRGLERVERAAVAKSGIGIAVKRGAGHGAGTSADAQVASSSRSARVISRISFSKFVVGSQPRSRLALVGSPISRSTSAGRTNCGSIST